ncbi:MAG TPA: Ig-like domain-containing protein [Longimicrobium sp.]|nr:Ig-like domain-containing protein [Longimicrobium sp.]
MRKLLVCSAIAVFAAGCKDGGGGEPSVATTVSVSPGSVALNAVGATQVVHATVSDQKGKAMRGAALSWSSSSAAVTVAGAGGDSAIVTAAGNGSASITAASGGVSGAVTVQVAQQATVVQKTGGDAQTGPAGTTLPQPVSVGVRDRLGQPVAGVTVNFAVVGGGSLSATSGVSSANGNVTVNWTLGTAAGSLQRVSATAVVGSVEFNATVVAGPAATATVAAGNNQKALRATAVATAPRVVVRDGFGNAVPGQAVQFAVTSGGGSIAGPTQTTDANGSAAVSSWTLGAALGTNSLAATFPGTGVPPVVFSAVAANAGTISIQNGDKQAAMGGAAVPTAPLVTVRDGNGSAMAGVQVTFTVTGGGGSVGSATATTNASGVASAGSWTLGPEAGPNALTASVAVITGPPVVFRGTGCTGGGGAGYQMTLCFTSTMSTAQRAAFQNAATRWAGVITTDQPDLDVGIPAGDCGQDSPILDQVIDDLMIFASVEPIDGPGAILGQAGWCYRRDPGLPILGVMSFDEADMNSLEAGGGLNAVILHEMGHVLGIGTLWSTFGFLQNPSGAGSVQDTWFSGANGIAGFNAIGGTTYTGGQKVPVENTGGAGTANSHWRESVLGRELMTGYLNNGSNPLSQLTVRSLADLGYTVNLAAADPFSLTASLQGAQGTRLRLENDVYAGPRFKIDRQGRRTRLP